MPIVIQAPSARLDLYELWEQMALTSPARAQQFIETVNEKFDLLAENPYLGRSRDELAPGLRSFPVEKYLIFYRSLEDGIEVARVVRGSRDLPPLFRG